ncbi:acetate/propionate family kinase [Janibacter sp. GXQ6167]|uniref:acetate/propionate family kinase n=1 Tax=Janibacter sp. GXQ6167 TaxID=3240791 RepID=UPI003525E47A
MSTTSPLVLVINAGSSSVKYQLIDVAKGETLSKGLIERVTDHGAALDEAIARIRAEGYDLHDLLAVGHRVVHGGARFSDPTLITPAVRADIEDLAPLAPLHNPPALLGIDAAMEAVPGVPQVAVCDTAFHQSIPAAAHTYAVPEDWRTRLRVRRYGFHGTSVSSASRRAAELLGLAYEQSDLVVLHLGNGASATAVHGGQSVDTSMGLTPLEGLVMGTRSGDVDPALHTYLGRVAGLDQDAVDRALNRESGLLGLAGVSDFREVLERREAGDEAAALTFDVVVHRLVKYVGAYAAELGRLDAIVFTGGIGEHAAPLRAAVIERLGLLGMILDASRNDGVAGDSIITADDSPVAGVVIAANEELEIARQAYDLVAGA